LHLEFLYGIGRGAEIEGIEGGVGVAGAVEEEIVGVGAVAADADGRALAGAPVERIHIAGLRAVADVRACTVSTRSMSMRPLREVLPRQRLDHFANAGVGGVQNVEHGGHDLQRAAGGKRA